MKKTQHILITGSSSGFGLDTARLLVSHGHTVFATMRDSAGRNKSAAQGLQVFAAEQPGQLHVIELDVTQEESVVTAVQKAADLTGQIDVVVNNAGIGVGIATYGETVTAGQWQHIFDVNVIGVQRVMRAVLPLLRHQKQGLIVNISSTMGRIVLPFSAAYTASKYALEGLAESYRYELAGLGIDVAVVEPGGFGTDFWAKLEPAGDAGRINGYDGVLAELPQKLYGGMGDMLSGPDAPDPQDVARAVLGLVEMDAGQRPFRTVVDPLMGGSGPTAINQFTEEIQAKILQGMGLKTAPPTQVAA